MIKKISKLIIIIFAIIAIGCAYLNTNFYITKQEWKHRDGASVGDWIEFDNVFYSLKGRTIYKKDSVSGKIVFCFGKMLIVKEKTTGKKGYYINKTIFSF